MWCACVRACADCESIHAQFKEERKKGRTRNGGQHITVLFLCSSAFGKTVAASGVAGTEPNLFSSVSLRKGGGREVVEGWKGGKISMWWLRLVDSEVKNATLMSTCRVSI